MAPTTGNSSASIPLIVARLPPQVTFRLRSLGDSSSSMVCPSGSEPTRSVRSRAGTVISPPSVTLPGTQQVMPISRFVAVSFSPPSSVRSRTLARTGRVARLATARLTIPSPRARFSCMTEMFIDCDSTTVP
jgi:hypothetical protein